MKEDGINPTVFEHYLSIADFSFSLNIRNVFIFGSVPMSVIYSSAKRV
jgi:hypothetical protein